MLKKTKQKTNCELWYCLVKQLVSSIVRHLSVHTAGIFVVVRRRSSHSRVLFLWQLCVSAWMSTGCGKQCRYVTRKLRFSHFFLWFYKQCSNLRWESKTMMNMSLMSNGSGTNTNTCKTVCTLKHFVKTKKKTKSKSTKLTDKFCAHFISIKLVADIQYIIPLDPFLFLHCDCVCLLLLLFDISKPLLRVLLQIQNNNLSLSASWWVLTYSNHCQLLF